MEAVPHLAERLLVWFEISNSPNGLENLPLITFSCFDCLVFLFFAIYTDLNMPESCTSCTQY